MASTANSHFHEAVSLRPATLADAEFLLHVYACTRQEEMALWGWSAPQQSSFIRMQYDARKRGYASAYPSAVQSVILLAEVPAGSIIVFRGAREIRLLDIALLPEFRGRGIGASLIAILISEASRSELPVRLSVLKGNRAARLYGRLGFVAKSGDDVYCEMECLAAAPRGDSNAPNTTWESFSNAGKSE